MPPWVKVGIVLVTMPTWMTVVVVELVKGELPSPALLGIPAALIIVTSGGDYVINVHRDRKEEPRHDEHS